MLRSDMDTLLQKHNGSSWLFFCGRHVFKAFIDILVGMSHEPNLNSELDQLQKKKS